jgi:hypothetical protein
LTRFGAAWTIVAASIAAGCQPGGAKSRACDVPGPALTFAADALPLATLDGATLTGARAAQYQCPGFSPDVAQLRSSARFTEAQPLRTVMDKTTAPPSGDRHDFLSVARFYWPDPAKSDGLPWIHHDGSPNPDALGPAYDKSAIDALFARLETLSVAYFFLGDEEHVAHLARALDAWFVDPATAMTPHLRYAEGVPGKSTGRSKGLITFSKLPALVNALALTETSPTWADHPATRDGVRSWMTKYAAWLATDPAALGERAAANNHGTYFDVQAASLALLLGRTDEARAIVEGAKARRFDVQLTADGFEPLETIRPSGWFYSCFNLRGLMDLAAIGQQLGVDLWHYETPSGSGIRKVLDTLVPYARGEATWPYHGHLDVQELYEPLVRAARAYDEPRYAQIAAELGGGAALDKSVALVDLMWWR